MESTPWAAVSRSPTSCETESTAFTDLNARQADTWVYGISAITVTQNEGEKAVTSPIDISDAPPDAAVITGLATGLDQRLVPYVDLTWDWPSGAPFDLKYVAIYLLSPDARLGYVLIGIVNVPQVRTFRQTGLENGQTYTYAIRPLDWKGQASPYSATQSIVAGDTRRPAAPVFSLTKERRVRLDKNEFLPTEEKTGGISEI